MDRKEGGLCLGAGLRKVTDDMKTHKNPTLRDAPPAKPTPSGKPIVGAKPQKPAATAPAHPPKCALDGKKWIVVSVTLSVLSTALLMLLAALDTDQPSHCRPGARFSTLLKKIFTNHRPDLQNILRLSYDNAKVQSYDRLTIDVSFRKHLTKDARLFSGTVHLQNRLT